MYAMFGSFRSRCSMNSARANSANWNARSRLSRRSAATRVRGQIVILVDDGLATGSSMHAAATALREKHPARIVIAVPVARRTRVPPCNAKWTQPSAP